MSDTNIVKNWSYPFKAAGESSKEINDPQVYFDALAKAENGFYPMGKNGLWHGGVHFDDNTAALLDQSSIRCIADGEVIAYRIDQIYPETQYGSTFTPGAGPEAVTAKYSTGFVLVKHLLELPPAPPPPSASGATTPSTGAAPIETGAETAPAPPSSEPTAAPERLTFYSLYMHLLDLTSYEANPALQRPAFWGAGLCKVKSDAPDKVRGLNVREHYKVGESNEHYAQYQNKLATLPRGTRIETGEAAPSPNQNWRRLIRATPAVEGLAENTGWVYVLEAKELAENQYLVSEDKSKDVPAIEQIGLHVRESASGSSDVLAVLPRGTEIQVSGEGNYVKLESIISGNAIPPLTVGADGKLPGYVWLQSLEAQRSPSDLAKDKVYPLPTAQRIKAGELIGHMGLYQEYDQSAPKTRLHLEVFSCEDVPAFIEKSRARAESLPNDQKTLIMVDVGSTIYQPTPANTQIAASHDVRPATDSPTEGRWVKVHPYVVLKAKKAGFGSFDGAHNRYPMDADKRTELASEFDLNVSELPDTADFLLESYKEDGSNMYAGKTNIPSTHVLRKVGIKLNTPVWVKRNALNAQTRRSSTSSTLEAWKNFPLSQATDNGQTCGFERILSKASWSDLSADHKAIDADTQKSRWWYVTVANSAGQDISGWVPETDLIVTQCSPWDWPGFSYIEDSTTLVSQQAQTLNAQGVLSPEEARTYAAKIEEAEHGPIFQRLFEIIDQPNNEGIRDKELTPLEIKTALEKPWLAQQLSFLLTHYESEWFWKETKWNELDALMAAPPKQVNTDWEKEKQRIKNLSWWSELVEKHSVTPAGQAWHINPITIIGNFKRSNTSICGCQLGKIFTCVRYTGSTTQYGPQYKGSISLENYENWSLAISNGVVTEEEKTIFIAMSPNEGNLDSIQSYDSEILTAGAMQKTINPAGSGEFPMQVFDFQEKYPNLYEDLFVKCGWTVQGPRHAAKMYYSNSDLTSGNPITGSDLKSLIRVGYSQSTQGSKCESTPLAAILTAIKSTEFIEQQVFDFSRRMKSVLEIKPAGYEFKLGDILKSALGKATALDHHINRPGYVDDDFGASLDRFFKSNPSVPTNISTWGSSHENYELELLEDYGNTRRMAMQNGISVAPARYVHLKDKLQ